MRTVTCRLRKNEAERNVSKYENEALATTHPLEAGVSEEEIGLPFQPEGELHVTHRF